MGRPQRRFTVYDVMESKGMFEDNPANVGARDAQGLDKYKKAEYPRMLYHPKGEERVTKPAEAVATPFGPRWVGEQKELIWKIVNDPSEETKLLKEGWHKIPLLSIRQAYIERGETPPEIPVDSVDAMRIASEKAAQVQRDEMEAMRVEIAELKAASQSEKTKK